MTDRGELRQAAIALIEQMLRSGLNQPKPFLDSFQPIFQPVEAGGQARKIAMQSGNFRLQSLLVQWRESDQNFLRQVRTDLQIPLSS